MPSLDSVDMLAQMLKYLSDIVYFENESYKKDFAFASILDRMTNLYTKTDLILPLFVIMEN